jgi:3-methyladenine DNA glycosylase AlkD
MNSFELLQSQIARLAEQSSQKAARFFKTNPGDYSAHDQFNNICVPDLRKLANTFSALSHNEIQQLITSPINEERLLSLFILIKQYNNSDKFERQTIVDFYNQYLDYVNNWNLVDASAHLILGRHYYDNQQQSQLLPLVTSTCMWHRRIAIVATWYFIRQHQLQWTTQIAERLLNDNHDLIHKAVGWMLREAGKKDEAVLKSFLNHHATNMPRTMLRYAIEKFTPEERQHYLQKV